MSPLTSTMTPRCRASHGTPPHSIYDTRMRRQTIRRFALSRFTTTWGRKISHFGLLSTLVRAYHFPEVQHRYKEPRGSLGWWYVIEAEWAAEAMRALYDDISSASMRPHMKMMIEISPEARLPTHLLFRRWIDSVNVLASAADATLTIERLSGN